MEDLTGKEFGPNTVWIISLHPEDWGIYDMFPADCNRFSKTMHLRPSDMQLA
jgi:hypothetical protein